MKKIALTGPWAETLGTMGTGMLGGALQAQALTAPLLSIPANTVGTAQTVGSLVGYVRPTNRKDIKNFQKSKLLNAIPGVGVYRLNQRRKQIASRYNGGSGYEKPLSQIFGGLSSAGLLALVGAGLGASIGAISRNSDGVKVGLGLGAAIGGGAGLAATGFGSLAALLTKTRDSKAQKQYEQRGNTMANYIIPGVAGYNSAKSFGHILNSKDYLKDL